MAEDDTGPPLNWPQARNVIDPAASIAALARLMPQVISIQVSQLPTLALLAGDNQQALQSLLRVSERMDKAIQLMMELHKTFVPAGRDE